MQQSIVSVVMPVLSGHVDAARAKIDELRELLGGGDNATGSLRGYEALRDRLPTLHFLSVVVFDETAGVEKSRPPFSPLLQLRDVLRLCSPPLGAGDALFNTITAPGSRVPIAPLLDRQSVYPAAGHIGARGLSRDRILRHNELYWAVQRSLPLPPDTAAQGAAAIHQWMRAKLLPDFPWLTEPYAEPLSLADRRADRHRLLLFGVLVLSAAALPWLLLGALLHPTVAAAAALMVGALCLTTLRDIGNLALLGGNESYPDAWWHIALGLLLALVVPLAILRTGFGAWIVLLIAGCIASGLILLAAIRRRERADPIPADSVPDPAMVRQLRSWEDCHSGGPDHMASVVIISAGWLRGFLIRFGMKALGLSVRITGITGYLGSMRTIHFAHWAIVDEGRRLLFLSNFDGSWESYLDDFIEKAHVGLTLAWGNCLGFPPAEYLTLKGATQGRKFKAWARCSMTPSRLWYSAYPSLTVDQIYRQAAIVQGLSAPNLPPDKATLWARTL
jgi:hypothetical protein